MRKLEKLLLTGIAAVCLSGFSTEAAKVPGHPGMEKANPAAKKDSSRSIEDVRFIGSEILPNEFTYKDTVAGGFSGVTYNPKNHKWLLLSDDRSDLNPARFYSAKLNYNARDFQNVQLTDVTYLKQPDGTLYPNRDQYLSGADGVIPDPESIRFDPEEGHIWYTSEGDRSLGFNPYIHQAALDGRYLSETPVNETIKMNNQTNKGFQNNLALEASTFSADGQTYWTAMEGPLIQDDTLPTPDSGALSRMTQYDRDGNLLAEYAYPIDAIPEAPGEGMHADNGVTEILSINEHEFLVLERSSVQDDNGDYSNYVRIYKVDISGATDIKTMESIKEKNLIPAKKELIVDVNTLDLNKVDNIEGMTWGKQLPNGHDSLVLVSDNNFNDTQITQFIALEVIPEDE
ncbi:esterase-like activity of phytase family protein [Salinibacillus aidingensis]|uniref:Esterase-like activity of phytase family protein n=1 Tax=Salinibacillus aidingensis TaxID=237684 RepID=A0ABN1BNI9_9BACI